LARIKSYLKEGRTAERTIKYFGRSYLGRTGRNSLDKPKRNSRLEIKLWRSMFLGLLCFRASRNRVASGWTSSSRIVDMGAVLKPFLLLLDLL